MSKLFRGYIDKSHSCRVDVDGKPLPLCLRIRSHSPTGFAWGYGGSGPSQLALAVLVYLLGPEKGSDPELYQNFKWEVIAALPQGEAWSFTAAEVMEWVHRWEQKKNEKVAVQDKYPQSL